MKTNPSSGFFNPRSGYLKSKTG